MKNPYDADALHSTIQRALASAGLDTTTGPMHEVSETIRRALGAAGLSMPGATAPAADTIDVQARVVDIDGVEVELPAGAAAGGAAPGSFVAHEFANHAGSRGYKLYVPARRPEGPPPLLVMLHGCTQSADDFAVGTRMNRLADTHGFLVLYPEQGAQANPSRCWNWFSPADQHRDAGEPALIAGMVQTVAARHGVDGGRIYVAGLSAGAAMAVVLGQAYPDLFAGVGAHSGLPYASAHDIPSAMAAMKGGRSGVHPVSPAPRPPVLHAVPTIVFHGDRDHTVQAVNGDEIERQAAEARAARGGALKASITEGRSAGGRGYRRTVHADAGGRVHVEAWTLHGAGHAWSGGDAGGSFTDGKGPDASAEMLRFFLALPPAGKA